MDSKDVMIVAVVVLAMLGALSPVIMEYINDARGLERLGPDCTIPGDRCTEGSYCRAYEAINDTHGFASYKGFCVKSAGTSNPLMPGLGNRNSLCGMYGEICTSGLVCCLGNIKVFEDNSVDCRPPRDDQYGVCVCARLTPKGECDVSNI